MRREAREEIGIEVQARSLLYVDYLADAELGDALNMLFDCRITELIDPFGTASS